tara:strand:- start:8631 stop:9377 length:747 start_codon:yes stop_codon:yes gene_type:complete
MTVEEMHYDFKLKFNKLDSQDYQNFQVPEIDWILNEAQWVFLKQRYGLTNPKQTGFEGSQKRIDDLRNLVVRGTSLAGSASVSAPMSVKASLPADYMFMLRVEAVALKLTCGQKNLTCRVTQHDDLSNTLSDPYYTPSYEWGEIPIVFGTETSAAVDADTMFGYHDGSFSIINYLLDYLRTPKRIAFPSGVTGGSYNYPGAVAVAANQDCELAEHTHNEIVDLAVQIAAGDVEHPGLQIKMAKTAMFE